MIKVTKIKTSWLSVYLYVSPPWENFLITAVSHFVDQLTKENAISSYFFIRYWEKGPHIRLRMLPERAESAQRIEKEATAFFGNFLKVHPGTYDADNGLENIAMQNTLEWNAYEPEITRYGGKDAIFLAEEHFEHSSRVVLNLIENNIDDWNYDTSLGVAIQTHLSFSFATQMSQSEAIFFYTNLFQTWLPRAYNWNEQMPAAEVQAQGAIIFAAFEDAYHKQKQAILPFFNQFWESLSSGSSDGSMEVWQKWVDETAALDKKLITLNAANRLDVPAWYREKCLYQNIGRPEFFIYESFFHMSNNRLGIGNQDEGFLAYILVKCFESITGPEH